MSASSQLTVEKLVKCSCWSSRILRWTVKLWFVLMLLGASAALAYRPILVFLGGLLRVDNPVPSDALIILLGGPTHRPKKAAELYREGLAPKILLCDSGILPVLDLNESDLTRRFLIREGIPDNAICVLPGGPGLSTRDEAIRIQDYVKSHQTRILTVVTTSFHTGRAHWILRKMLQGTGVRVHMAAARHPAFDEQNWYTNEDGLLNYLQELIKTIYYHIKY